MSRKIIKTDKAPAAAGPYSQGIEFNGIIFTSGQLPMNPASVKMIEGEIGEKTKLILNNIKAIIEAEGSSLENIIKCTIFLTNMGDFGEVNKAYGSFFTENPPARSCIEVRALPLGANIEIEAIACK